MINITNQRIDEYLHEISATDTAIKEGLIFEQMQSYAREQNFPIIGPLAGRFLRQLAISINAKTILEMGSGYGYSAMWFAGGLADDGKIICTDNSADNRNLARDYFLKAGYDKAIDFRVGNALEIARLLAGPFDIILNDIDKEQYPESFDIAIRLLRKGGIFLTDNVVWLGRILDENPDKTAQAVLEFNRKLFNSPEVLSSIIPIRDGLGMAVKLT